jgi:hypothetical protein
MNAHDDREASELASAFDAAAGRASHGETVPAGLLRTARGVLAARIAGLAAEPCPARAMARARAAFDARRGALSALARLMFDSALVPAAARRGLAVGRTLRFARLDDVLDVAVSRVGPHKLLRLAVEACEGPVEYLIQARPSGHERRLVADATGYAVARMARTTRRVCVRVLVYGRERLRTPDIDLS